MGGVEDDQKGNEAEEIAQEGADHPAADIGLQMIGRAAVQVRQKAWQQKGEQKSRKEAASELHEPVAECTLRRIRDAVDIEAERGRQIRDTDEDRHQIRREGRSRAFESFDS